MQQSTPLRNTAVIVLLALIWGSSFILMKKGMRSPDGLTIFSPNQVAALRLGIAAIVMSPFLYFHRKHITKINIGWLLVVGLLGSGIPAFLFTNAQLFIHSSMSGILNALTPLFTLLVGFAFFSKKIHRHQLLGVLIGLVGAVGLVSLRGLGDSQNLAYSGLILIATLSYGVSVNTIHTKLSKVPAAAISSISLAMAGIPCILYLLSTRFTEVLEENPFGWKGLASIATLAIFGTALGNLLFFSFTQRVGALAASSITYLIPVVAILWGIADNEPFTWIHGIFASVIITGIYLVNRSK
ncbi:MAG: DMT family transporter [Bacteroidota bacterium]|jgi:drug/metabolite transporter (DMT)-like permease